MIEGLKAGKPMFGKDGAIAQLIQDILNAVLEGEMDAHLTEEKREFGNCRNGKTQKQVRTFVEEITVCSPRDRDGSFELICESYVRNTTKLIDIPICVRFSIESITDCLIVVVHYILGVGSLVLTVSSSWVFKVIIFQEMLS